jgi:hypothetical protein
MKIYTKFLSIIPIIALSSCSVNRLLNKEQAINTANDILEKQNNGTVVFSEYTYNGQMSLFIEDDDEISEATYYTLQRSYKTPYLHFLEVHRDSNQETGRLELWIYQTSGNVIFAVSDSQSNNKYYTAYPLTLENTFYDLVNSTKEVTNIEHIETLIYSQNILKSVEESYAKPLSRDIYQGYNFVVYSDGRGDLTLNSKFYYQEGNELVAYTEDYRFDKYLFKSLEHNSVIDYVDINNEYDSITLTEKETIYYKVNKTYPDLNNFTFMENN